MADVLIRLIDLIDELLDRDIVLRSIRQTLIERLLQLGVLILSVFKSLLKATLLLFQSCDAGVLPCQILTGILQFLR